MPVCFWLCVCWCVGCALVLFWGVIGVCRWMHDFLFMFLWFWVLPRRGLELFFVFVFWLGLGFSRPGFDLFVESLILAQDERWRRA